MRAARNRARFNGTTIEDELARDMAAGPRQRVVWLQCADCGARIRHLSHRDAGNPPERCSTCRPVHIRAATRARANGTTVEEEKTRIADGKHGHCLVCRADVPNMRHKYCSDTCRTVSRRASFRAFRYGTTFDEELVRGEREGWCRVCGELTRALHMEFCDECRETGRRRVYRRAIASYGATHDEAVALALIDECEVCHAVVDRLVPDGRPGYARVRRSTTTTHAARGKGVVADACAGSSAVAATGRWGTSGTTRAWLRALADYVEAHGVQLEQPSTRG